jgi:hypothetical protein
VIVSTLPGGTCSACLSVRPLPVGVARSPFNGSSPSETDHDRAREKGLQADEHTRHRGQTNAAQGNLSSSCDCGSVF